jgi:integrase/recombinase XerC
MLHNYIEQFLHYCQVSNFPPKSLEALRIRLKHFNRYCQTSAAQTISEISYEQLLEFVADFGSPSVHVKKNRIWTLKHFYRFLKLNKIIAENPVRRIPYPKIEKKVPKYLTMAEFKVILRYFAAQADTATGLRNFIIIMLLGFLGLRLGTLLKLNIEDVDTLADLLHVREKGSVKRLLPLPGILSEALAGYLKTEGRTQGALLLSKRKKRISQRTVQDILCDALAELDIDKHLHAHLFRHTAATYLNKVAGTDVTQQVLGHSCLSNTEKYTHLNPDVYAVYMRQHPYMNL